MKTIVASIAGIATLTCLLGCPEDKPAAPSKTTTAAATAKPVASAAPAASGGW